MKIVIKLKDGRKMNATLDENAAPITVQNFVKLIDEKFFDGLIFHRVIPGFMIQGGGMDGAMKEKRAKSIKGEFASNGIRNPISHVPGVLSMARTQVKDSASSQFFICVADCTFLDGDYAAFGRLDDEESLKVAIDMSNVKTGSYGWFDDVPKEPLVIDTIEKVN